MTKLIGAVLYVYNYISKNLGLILGIAENIILALIQVVKAVGGVVSITPSRKDDVIVNAIEKLFEEKVIYLFDKVKAVLYKVF